MPHGALAAEDRRHHLPAMRIPPPPPHRPHCGASRSRVALPLALALLMLGGCLSDPNAGATTAEAITALGEELSYLKQDNAQLQMQLDSLRYAVARQDTLVRRLAGMAGVPVP
ncbi:MAG: hypothetical protein ACYC4J_02700 [Gemmatimonadaceae bacterium]